MAEFSYDEVVGGKAVAPAEKTFSYDEVANPKASASGQPNHDGAMANNGDEGWASGALKGAGTAVVKGLGDIPGTLGNMADLGVYGAGRAVSAITGRPIEDIMAEAEAGKATAKKWYQDHLGFTPPQFNNGEHYSDPVLEKTGEYKPDTIYGRLGMAGTQAAVGSLGGGPNPLRAGESLLLNAAKQGAPVVAGGMIGQGVTEATGDPLLAMLAGAAVPAAAGKVAESGLGALKDKTRILRPGEHQDIAAERLHGMADNPDQALADLHFQQRDIVPGSAPTTAQTTLDKGLVRGQKAAELTDPAFANRLEDQLGAQNVARGEHVEDMAPRTADAMSPGQHLAQQLTELENTSQAQVDRLAQGRDQLQGAIPDAVPAEDSGGRLRGVLQGAADAAGRRVSALFRAVDPEGNMTITSAPVRDAAEVIARSVNPDVEIPSPFLNEALNRAQHFPDTMRFEDYLKFDQALSALMSQAKRAGDYTGHGQLRALKGVVKQGMADAVDNQHALEQAQVTRGQLSPEQTIEARLRAERDAFLAARAQAGTGVDGGAGGASASVPPSPGANGQVSSGPRGAGRTGGVQPADGANGAAPMDEAAVARLGAANEAHADRAQTYRDGPVGQVLKDNGYKGQYTTPDSGVPAKAFVKGDKGYETAQAHLAASNGDPAAVTAMQDMAVTRLREAMGDGPLTEATLARWRQQHDGALRALDEVSPGFSNRFNSAARAQSIVDEATAARTQAIQQAQSGAAGKLIGAEHPDEVRMTVGRVMTAADGPTQMSALVDRVRGNADALAGLQRAGVEWIMDKVSNAGTSGGQPVVSKAKIAPLVNQHAGALEALYGPERVANMRRVAADLDRAQQAIDLVRARNGSDTAKLQELVKMFGDPNKAHSDSTLTWMVAVGEGFQHGGVRGAGAATLGLLVKKLYGNRKLAGEDAVNAIVKEGLLNPDVGRALLQRAVDKNGRLSKQAVSRLSTALDRAAVVPQAMQQPADEAEPLTIHRYADGGAVHHDEEQFMRDIIDQVAQRIRGGEPMGGLAGLRR